MEKQIYLYSGWLPDTTLIGTITTNDIRGKESVSFCYDDLWLENNHGLVLDPALDSFQGFQYPPKGQHWFGFLSDSAPDRWGRKLMERRELILSKKENRPVRRLTESDFLLGVHDEGRVGGFRFKTDKDSAFLSDEAVLAAPPMTDLRKLENASLSYESDKDAYKEKWLYDLLYPGSSLGGARPKANVKDIDGNLWIAKFPSRNDSMNIGAWEMVTHDLASMCDITVPLASLMHFSESGDTFLVKRFDREKIKGEIKRIHFASAMTMLGETDGSDNPISYLNIAEVLEEIGAAPQNDLRQLWQRIVFSIAVSNSDDHLRNHGFLLEKDGWHLSPAYDINPVYDSKTLSLNISLDDNTMDQNLALSVAPYFRFTQDEAYKYIESVKTTVSDNWQRLAQKYQIPRSEQEIMRQAFVS